jgi:molecular chaperone GrpE (heat shock protein)
VLAEQVNICDRALREIDRAAKFAGSQFAGDLLETLDNLRLAIASQPIPPSMKRSNSYPAMTAQPKLWSR